MTLPEPVAALTPAETERYGRQLLLPEMGVQGQKRLLSAKVLVVGAGGLGAPVLLYLAGAGVGTLGIVDYDVVERGNLHRQIIHSEERLGQTKVDSAAAAVKALNPTVSCHTYNTLLNSQNAMDIVAPFDVVVDASDNVPTRYLINDACVLLGKPLVSGSALRFDGQLTVYNYDNGPCYRCLFPQPPNPSTVQNCNDGGILGAVTGMIGSLQALECIKIITGRTPGYSGHMLLFDGREGNTRKVKLRGRMPQCAVCGPEATIKAPIDYEMFCGSRADDKARNLQVLPLHHRITCQTLLEQFNQHILIDVRPQIQFDICSLPGSHCLPFNENEFESRLSSDAGSPRLLLPNGETVTPSDSIVVICRRGNDSQLAAKMLLDAGFRNVVDLMGGLTCWSIQIDPRMPKY